MGSDFVNWPMSVWFFKSSGTSTVVAREVDGTHKRILWVPCFPFSAP